MAQCPRCLGVGHTESDPIACSLCHGTGDHSYSKELVGEAFGVPLPEGIRFFDCRSPDSEGVKAPWGETLYSSERAQVDLGLKRGFWDENDSTVPLSCSTYVDARTAGPAELTRQTRDMLHEALKLLAVWNRGGVYYRPVAVAMGNYGWSVICDKRTMVQGFGT